MIFVIFHDFSPVTRTIFDEQSWKPMKNQWQLLFFVNFHWFFIGFHDLSSKIVRGIGEKYNEKLSRFISAVSNLDTAEFARYCRLKALKMHRFFMNVHGFSWIIHGFSCIFHGFFMNYSLSEVNLHAFRAWSRPRRATVEKKRKCKNALKK